MKKLTLFFLALWVTCSVWAQQRNPLLNPDHPIHKQSLTQYRPVAPTASVPFTKMLPLPKSAKTSEDYQMDTLIQWAYWIDDQIDTVNCQRGVYFVRGGQLGYLNGTLDPIQLTTTNGETLDVAITHHGLPFRIPRRRTPVDYTKVWVDYVRVGVAPVSTVMGGQADTFRVQVFPDFQRRDDANVGTFAGTTATEPVASESFTVEGLNVGRFNDIPFLYNGERPQDLINDRKLPMLNGDYMFAVETKRAFGQKQYSDDTLALYFTSPNSACDPNNSFEWYISLVDVDTPQIGLWRTIRTLFYAREDYAQAIDIPAIIPVILFESRFPLSAENIFEESLFEAQGLKLYGNYPNPAPEFTNVAFEFTRNANVSFIVTDLNGRTVYESGEEAYAPGKHQKMIPTAQLACGTYSLMVRSKQGSAGFKFIVDR